MSTVSRFPFCLPDHTNMYDKSTQLFFPSYFHYYEFLRFKADFLVPENIQKFLSLPYSELVKFSNENKEYWKYSPKTYDDITALDKAIFLFLESNVKFINDLVTSSIAVDISSKDLLGVRDSEYFALQLTKAWNKMTQAYSDWAIEEAE